MTHQTLSSVLVTVGSTLFPVLTDLILSPPFLDHLSSLGVTRLVIQYGRADIHLPLLANDRVDGEGLTRFRWKEVDVDVMRFTEDFEGLIKRSEAVISHAGSGSILTVLRAPRPLLVVPNTSLMDNHQAELADALGREGYLNVSTVEDLKGNVGEWLRNTTNGGVRPFPVLEKERFKAVLDETAGFEP